MSFLLPNKISVFKVDGMMCVGGCVAIINSVSQSIDGVNSSSVDFKKGLLTVSYDSLRVNEVLIIDKLSQQTTYDVKKVEKKISKSLFDWLKIF